MVQGDVNLANAGVMAEQGETKTATATITLVPGMRGSTLKVGIQDGPTFLYTYVPEKVDQCGSKKTAALLPIAVKTKPLKVYGPDRGLREDPRARDRREERDLADLGAQARAWR